MNTLQSLIDNGIELYTAQSMIDNYSSKINTMNGIYIITDINYNFDIFMKINYIFNDFS